MQTLPVNNSRILRIKNTKFSEYYINLNSTIQEDFQICISVYLQIFLSKKQVSWSIKSIHSTTFFPVIEKQKGAFLILIWVGFLGVHFEVYVCMCSTLGGLGGGGNYLLCLKLVRIMLETSKIKHLARKYKHTMSSFRKYNF